jgi:hypothetical protein
MERDVAHSRHHRPPGRDWSSDARVVAVPGVMVHPQPLRLAYLAAIRIFLRHPPDQVPDQGRSRPHTLTLLSI